MSEKPTSQSSGTNWEKLGQLPDDQIDTSDAAPLDQSFFKRATLRTPRGNVAVTVAPDEDILAWFQAQGAAYQQQINAALRIYVEAHRDAAWRLPLAERT